jgi:hypothetical protein
MMSDPVENPQFRRSWVLLPPLKRKRRPASTGTANFQGTLSDVANTAPLTKAQTLLAEKQPVQLRIHLPPQMSKRRPNTEAELPRNPALLLRIGVLRGLVAR